MGRGPLFTPGQRSRMRALHRAGMNGAEDTPLITYEMLKRGYSEGDIRKVLGENFLRAFAQAEKVAGNRQISAAGSLMRLKP